jgi:cell division protein FtsQ
VVTEPRPADDQVPSTVLDELKLAFGDDDAADVPTVAADPLAVDVVPADPLPVDSGPADLGPVDSGPVDSGPVDSGPADLGPAARSTIVIGGGEELPDTMYLDDVIEGGDRRDDAAGGTGRTISIGNDLDVSGAFDAVPVPNRQMDPRVRERRIAVKRERGRRRLIIIGSIASVVVLLVAALAVLSSSLFAVERVDVQGATYSQARYPAEFQAVVDGLMGEPVLLVDTMSAERDLEQIPWIERAFVTTDFPNRVLIDVRERLPVAALVGSDERFRVIDRDGRVLDVLDGRPRDYMLITGPAPDVEPGELAGEPFALAAQLVSALPAEIRALTESVSVDATTGDFGLAFTGGIDVRLGTFDRIDSKLARLLQRVREGLDGIVGIDVSTDEISDITG